MLDVMLEKRFDIAHQGFIKHLDLLRAQYSYLLLLNIINDPNDETDQKDAETFLSNEYEKHYKASQPSINLFSQYFQYNILEECALTGEPPEDMPRLCNLIETSPHLRDCFCYVRGDCASEQQGVIRTNCFDCLDRTNKMQLIIGLYFLNKQFKLLRANCDMVSNLPNNSYDASNLNTTVMDESYQEAINLLVSGSEVSKEIKERAINIIPPLTLSILDEDLVRQMCLKSEDFTKNIKLQIGVGTYNTGATSILQATKRERLIGQWLVPQLKSINGSKVCDVYAVGFQEIINPKLNLTDFDNIPFWCSEIEEALNKSEKFSLVTYCQLMGICLFVYVKEKLVSFVTQVDSDSIQCEFGDEKHVYGGVAIRLLVCDTPICFICAHLPPGQDVVQERNRNIKEILNNLKLKPIASAEAHENIFLFGDLNYRLSLDSQVVRSQIKSKQWEYLQKNDQLVLSKRNAGILQGFQEGPLLFPPTHKYEVNKTNYDMSKNVTPSWCDRILWKHTSIQKFLKHFKTDSEMSRRTLISDHSTGSLVKCLHYGRAEMKFSSHRPVFGVFQIDVKRIIPKQFEKVHEEVVSQNGPSDATVSLQVSKKTDTSVTISDPNFVYKVIEAMHVFGQVVMVRFCFNVMLVTFSKCSSALAAVTQKQLVVEGVTLLMSVRNPSWLLTNKKEREYCLDNSVPILRSVIPSSLPGQIPIDELSKKLSKSTPSLPQLVITRSIQNVWKRLKGESRLSEQYNKRIVAEKLKASAKMLHSNETARVFDMLTKD